VGGEEGRREIGSTNQCRLAKGKRKHAFRTSASCFFSLFSYCYALAKKILRNKHPFMGNNIRGAGW